jgi:hypothetical protein
VTKLVGVFGEILKKGAYKSKELEGLNMERKDLFCNVMDLT